MLVCDCSIPIMIARFTTSVRRMELVMFGCLLLIRGHDGYTHS